MKRKPIAAGLSVFDAYRQDPDGFGCDACYRHLVMRDCQACPVFDWVCDFG